MVQKHKVLDVLPIPKYLPSLSRLAKLKSLSTTTTSSSSASSSYISDMITYVPHYVHDLGYTEKDTIKLEEDLRIQIKGMKGGEAADLQRIQNYV